MIESATGHQALPFMNYTARDNEIQMSPKDQEATTGRTPKGIFYYKVMPFTLNNAAVTY